MITSEWQKIDPDNGLVMPWYTHPALDEIKNWHLKDKTVLEYGAGASTIWWGDKCKSVFSIEANKEWFEKVGEAVKASNGFIALEYRDCNEGDQTKIDFYTQIPDWIEPDIVVVDGILRYECILKALTLPRPLTLIVDNWQQDYVFICPAAEEVMKDYAGQLFIQPDHKNHEGRPWTTAIWHLK